MSKLQQAIVQWENSLLDLGKRNRMINYPVTQGKRRSQQTLRLDEPGYAQVYDLLVRQGKSLTVQQPPVEKFDLRCEGVMRLFERLGRPIVPMQGDLRPAGSFTEYRAVLKNMRAKMKLAREEQGVDVLHLAVGFLDWKQLSGKEERLTSPLLLLPVRLKMQSIRAPYVLEMLDGDVVVNPALDQLFKMEYGLSLPELPDPEAPVDEYLDQVELLARQHGWQVRREAHLALMSFQKLSMYHDLKRSHERIAASDVLRAIAGEEPYPLDASVMDGVSLDAIPPEDSHLVVNADSSQHYAIELSRRGVSFCLQGPPGGGKSQTITNIIAQALADGKKVLFVAEKMAALDVVHRRLRDAGLGEFTLALHSHRADRKAILNDISQPLNLQRQELDHKAMATLDELEELRQNLNIYPRLLHRRREPLDESLYTVLGELAQLQDAPLVMASLTGAQALSRPALSQELTRISQLARAAQRYQAVADNPWQGLQGMWTSFMARTQLQGEVRAVLEDLQAVTPAVQALTMVGYLPQDCTLASLEALERVCAAAKALGPVSDGYLDACTSIAVLTREAMNASAQLQRAREEAQGVLLPGAQMTDVGLLSRLRSLEEALRTRLTGVRYQAQTEAFAAHYAALIPSVQRMHAATLQALELLNAPLMTGREADWALDAAAALAACPYVPDELASAAELEPLCAQLQSVRKEAARLHQKRKELLINWKPEALQLDPERYLRRFQNEYAGFSRMLNLQMYAQDMRSLGHVYCGHARLDDTIAKGFLNRLAAWQEDKRLWSAQAQSVTSALGVPTMEVDGAWEALESQLNAVTALSRCADTPAHRSLLMAAAADPALRQQAALITEPLRFAMLDRSLRSADFSGDALADDVTQTLDAVRITANALAELRGATEEMRALCQPGLPFPAMLSGLQALEESRRAMHALKTCADALRPLLPGETVTADSDFAALHNRAGLVSDALSQSALLPEGTVRRLLSGAQPLPDLTRFALMAEARERLAAFSDRFSDGDAPLAQPLPHLQARLERCLALPDALDLWQEWRDALAGMADTLFAPFVPAAQKACIPTEQWTDAARKLFLYTWVEHVLGEEHLLALFRAHTHEERIQRFGSLDEQQLHIARSRIRKQLIDLIPDEAHRALSASDELAILQRELLKKRGHLPLRKLFGKIPNLLTTLKPCLMMSPLSVASFLESEELTFDLVIFDEASQIMPENAIGAILRGKQVIVTGDTKQMPPTDFFTVSVTAHDYDGEEDEEEQEAPPEESILEQCTCVLPSCPLLWHYRSRHESLIAFSNREIYAGRLVTFPGSIDRQPHLGVELEYVPDGVFSRRRNRQEARRCIRLIEEHILERSHRSLGVVAFSRTQQSAIEEELHRFRIAHPEYDGFFDEGRDEPFFIKNLENVQGDERDTMIFSVGYAKTPDGKPMSLNLGPLSASGGERRLNVAVTRARYNVKLVTSVLAGDIDLRRTSAEGTRLLRAYIDYAEKGYAAIEADAPAAPAKDAFVSRLEAVLTQAGYEVERSVGCSDCRVDLAVRRPADGDAAACAQYVLGVMTDGAAYAAQRTCRDRDSLQSSVLRGMGWRLHRVWSADWLQRPDGVERELLAAVEAAMAAPAGLPDAPAPASAPVWSHPAQTEDVPLAITDYHLALLPEKSELPINELLLRVVETEQPVHRDEVCRRLAPALGYERVTPALRKDVEVAIARLLMDDLREADGFLTMAGFTLALPRRAGVRPIDMISPVELEMAVMLVAEHSIGAPCERVIIRAAELLGFERRGPRIQKALENALDTLVRCGRLQTADGRIQAAAPGLPAAAEADPTALPAPDAPLALPPADATSPEVTDHD